MTNGIGDPMSRMNFNDSRREFEAHARRAAGGRMWRLLDSGDVLLWINDRHIGHVQQLNTADPDKAEWIGLLSGGVCPANPPGGSTREEAAEALFKHFRQAQRRKYA